MRSSYWCCRAAIAAVICVLAAMLACPERAQAGFLEDFFGSLFQPPVSRGYREAPPWGMPGFHRRGQHSSHKSTHRGAARKKIIAAAKADTAAQPQQPVDIMADNSLRKGDAVMTQSGIRIFVGQTGNRHEAEDFKKPTEIRRLSKSERRAFAALDGAGSGSAVPAGIITGRSATSRPITAGQMITDAKGKVIRYVGP
jgi:hypothetical protein